MHVYVSIFEEKIEHIDKMCKYFLYQRFNFKVKIIRLHLIQRTKEQWNHCSRVRHIYLVKSIGCLPQRYLLKVYTCVMNKDLHKNN
jgi:hypothetical protein